MKSFNQIKIIEFLWSELIDKFQLYLADLDDMIPPIKNL